jgi:hypothetical protein
MRIPSGRGAREDVAEEKEGAAYDSLASAAASASILAALAALSAAANNASAAAAGFAERFSEAAAERSPAEDKRALAASMVAGMAMVAPVRVGRG